jgi:nitrous oxide reductase accessory protein NosL
MKIIKTIWVLMVLGIFITLQAGMFQSVNVKEATLLQQGNEKKFCSICGMNLPMFYKTNHVATVDGKVKQYCSLHCLVEDKEFNHADVKNIKVVDVHSLKFLDAKKAYYVVASKKKGTMSMVSKYAFASEAKAKEFAHKFGGKVMRFDEAYAEAKKDFAHDARMIAKKQKMMAQKGAMMYKKMCQKTDKTFTSVAEAKAYVSEHKLCGSLNPKQLQAIGLYLSKEH